MSKNKNFNPSDLSKKLQEINMENEKLLKNENALKEEQDKKIAELISGFDKEKEAYKKRISEIEKNLRDAEGKKGTLLLELEKEKAKWNIEKDNLTTKYSELNDKLLRDEKKIESLLRENEKLRNEKNMLRRAGATTTGKYSLMLREGGSGLGSSLGSSIINQLGGKSNFGVNYKNAMLKVLGEINQENENDGGNKERGNFGSGEEAENMEKIDQK